MTNSPVIVVSGLLLTVCAHAQFMPLSRCAGQRQLSNNINECQEPARAAIIAAKKKWAFDFDCFAGKLDCISGPPGSPINTNWPTFVMENAIIFGHEPEDFSVIDGVLVQVWKGVPISRSDMPLNRTSYHPPPNPQRSSPVPIDFVATASWSFSSEPRISKEKAAKLARDQWFWPLFIKNTRLSIHTGCGSDRRPALVWELEAYPVPVIAPQPTCYINAENGTVCGRCELEYSIRPAW